MNYNAVFMLTGLSLIKKIKLFNSKARNILCLTGDTRDCIFHMDLISFRRCCCCKSALVRIKRNTWNDSAALLRRTHQFYSCTLCAQIDGVNSNFDIENICTFNPVF